MGDTTGITWTDSTFNPWVGCQRVSPGCVNCYAEALDKRMGGGVDPADDVKKLRWGPTAPRTRTSTANWRKPVQWNARAAQLKKRHRVFCSSLADVFEDRPELIPWRADLFALIDSTPWLDWQLLTKRPENIARLLPSISPITNWSSGPLTNGIRVRDNVWLGTTVEDQQRANERIAHLVSVPARVHFLSVEPQLEPIQFPLADFDHVEWVIVGGESGGKAREFRIEWARHVAAQCTLSGAAFFMKQFGDNPTPPIRAGHHNADVTRFPPDLQRQEFPREALS